jgi:hypothetical protein
MQMLQGIESGVASINGGNSNHQTTTNLTEVYNNPELDNLDLIIQEAFVPTDQFDFVNSAAKVVNRRVSKLPRLSPSTAMSELAVINKNSEDHEREWKMEQERNKEEWKREREEREDERQRMREERDREEKQKEREWERKREEREEERERKRQDREEERERKREEREEREQEKNREMVRSLAVIMATVYAGRPADPNNLPNDEKGGESKSSR